MPTPLISIIINCYNGEKFLKNALDSIYEQTYKNWEIIFWDNLSTDSSSIIAKSYDDKLKYYKSEKFTSLGKARVMASQKISGDYIAFLDSDDYWLPEKLEKQINLFINNKKIAMVYGRSKIIFEDSTKKNFIHFEGKLLPTGNIFSQLSKENFIIFSSAMVDAKVFFQNGGFPQDFLNSTDYWIFMRIARNNLCEAIQDICCVNRIHNNNLSSSQEVIGAEESIKVLTTLLPDDRLKSGLKYQYTNLSIMYLKEGKIIKSFYNLIKFGSYVIFFKRLYSWILNLNSGN